MIISTPQNEGRKLICEACGSEFSCSADKGRCWCFDINIESSALLETEKKYGDCLCGDCLREISANFDGEGFTTDKTSL
jgi:hypothetical protein